MKVLVCGGRDFKDWPRLAGKLMAIHKEHRIELLIQGGARGADLMAKRWANANGIPVRTYAIYGGDWEKYGNGAGPVRNRRMYDAEKPDIVVAFPGHSGTADMRAYAASQGAKIIDG